MAEAKPYDYSQDTDSSLQAGGNVLAEIAALAHEQLQAEAKVKEAEEALELVKNQLKDIKCRRFPMKMIECGQKKLTTITNLEVALKDTVRASIPEQNQPAAFAWLEETGNGGVIKIEVKAEFGKGPEAEAKAQQVLDFCNALHVVANGKKSVHPMTLASLIREMLENGKNVPLDLLGAIVQQEVTVKPVKVKAK